MAYNPKFRRVGRLAADQGTALVDYQYSRGITLSAGAGCVVFSAKRAAVVAGAAGVPDTETAVFLLQTTPTATPEWISVSPAGTAGDLVGTTGEGFAPLRSVSSDCSRVAFRSTRSLDGTMRTGTYVRDRTAGTTVRASFTDSISDKAGLMGISADGSTVMFHDTRENRAGGPTFTNPQEVWAFDVAAGTRRWITDVQDTNFSPSIVFLTSNGSRALLHAISYRSLIAGQYTLTCSGNCLATVDTTMRAARQDVSLAQTIPSESANGTTVAMSHDGARVAVMMQRSIFWIDVATGETRLINPARGTTTPPTSGATRTLDINADGRFVVFDFNGPTLLGPQANGRSQIYRYDASSSALELITTNADGTLPRFLAGTTESFPDYRAVSVDGTGQVIAFVASESPQYGNGLAAPSNDPRVTGLWLWDNR